MNEYNEFLANVAILNIFGELKPKVIEKHKIFLKYNLANTFIEDFPIHTNMKGKFIEGAIYLTFQFGPFLYIPYCLLKNGIRKIKIFVSELSGVSVNFLLELSRSNSLDLTIHDFVFWNSSSEKEINVAIENGETIVLILDSIPNSENENDSFVPIEFINTIINMPNLVIQKAYLANYPIVQAIGVWDENKKVLDFSNVDYKGIRYKEMLQDIYDRFSNTLKKFPSQWESYQTMHKYIQPNITHTEQLDFSSVDLYQFNASTVKIFNDDKGSYLGSYASAKIFSVPVDLIQLIKTCLHEKTKFKLPELLELFNDQYIIKMLIAHNIIIKDQS